MARVYVFRLLIALLALIAAFLLTSLAYELVVTARWNPALAGEGKSRWALLQFQNNRRDPGALLVAWEHFSQRLAYPATRPETILRGLVALGATLSLAAGIALFAVVMRKPTHHGNARFGSLIDAGRKGLLARQGLILGRLSGATITSDDPSHVLVVGPTRSGKGVSFVIPNGYSWRGSSVWFDPKREIFEAIGAHRQALGDKVFMFSPGERETHRFNPLDFIRRDAHMATDAAVVASFIVPEGTGSSEIWARTGRQLLTALIGYVVASPRYEGQRHLRAVTNLTATGVEFLRVLTNIRDDEQAFLPSWVVQGLNQFIALEKETRNSAYFNLTAALNPWTNDLVAAATASTDFDIAQLRKDPTAIFIGCSVAQLDIFRPIIKILIQQIHDVLMTAMPSEGEPHQVLIVIDEFRQLGKMESLVSKLTINAGYGFRMVLILQDVAQLDELYGKATRQTTVSACQVKLFIRMNDLETSEYVSKMLGSTTIEVRTPIIRAGKGIFASRDKSVSYQERALRTAEELRQMPSDRAIVLVPNAPGFVIGKLAYFRDAPFKAIYRRFRDRRLKVPPLPIWEIQPLTSLAEVKANLARGAAPAASHAPVELVEPEVLPPVRPNPAPAAASPTDLNGPGAIIEETPLPPEQEETPAPKRLDESDDDDIVELRPGHPIEATPLPKVAKTEEQTAEPSPRPARLLAIPMRPGARNVSISALLQANSDGTATEQVELMPAAMLADLSPEAQAAIDHVRRQIKDHGESRDSRS
ncbi:MAG: conjugal transfer protein TraG [Stutzerimonas stutzeri]|nr:MAG: conjugal transfer protein TraG [Stutzerimonas stutzeri]